MTRKPRIALVITGLVAGGFVIACALRVSDGKWTFRRLVCRQVPFPNTVANIQWERSDPLRLGILFGWGERLYRGVFTLAVKDFDQLRDSGGFTVFKGDYVPADFGTLPGWIRPNPKVGDYEIYFRDLGHGQEYLWRQPGDTNACYLLFDI